MSNTVVVLQEIGTAKSSQVQAWTPVLWWGSGYSSF